MALRCLHTVFLATVVGVALSLSSEPSAIDTARQKTIFLVQHLWKNVSDPHFSTMVRQEAAGSDKPLIRALWSIMRPIKETETPKIIDSLQYMYSWERINALSHGTTSLYETFDRFLEQRNSNEQPSPRRAWLDLAETILQDFPLSEGIHELILTAADGKENKTIFQHALKEKLNNVCESGLSTQLLLYNMYASMQLTQLKAYTMAQSAWALLQIYGQGDHEVEAHELTRRYTARNKEQAKVAVDAMKDASRELWQCDPLLYIEHTNNEQLTRLLQGYIENEVDMNPSQSCRGGCHTYEFTKNHGCYSEKFCSQQPKCEGDIINCQFIESDMKVCQSYPGSHRRYEYIGYKKQALLGTDRIGNADCNLVRVDSWWRFFLPAHCSYCFCLCDEAGPLSDRFFSLNQAEADVANNKVMTGLRFKKVNRVIYLQIQQASLLPHGGINSSSAEWMPLNTSKADYKMSWTHRSIDLDDLQAPKGHVLTGIRFRELGTHLNTEIMVTPINFNEGNLRRPRELSYWYGNENTDSSLTNPREEVKLASTNVPSPSSGPCQPDSKHDSYIKFTHSDLETDAAQTTVPFLDIQPVANTPPSLLSGAGLYHKGTASSAGFLAPKIFSYDITEHLTGEAK